MSLIDAMLASGYGDREALRRRRAQLQEWIARPQLLKADEGARYAAEVVIDLEALDEPVLCCPNDPDDAKLLSSIGAVPIDEVFLGSCMTTASHFSEAGRALGQSGSVPVRFWAAPPTRMAERELRDAGTYAVLERSGARLEIPGCSLCMGNQARVADDAVVVSTSTRNFPNRMGNGAQVYLSSARVAGLAARLGRLPSLDEYRATFG
ncbi:aconitase family protein [Cupriavidus oxalaticus]|uniref:aconitase family protein n=1 Tax=Cupriavidus oxalaticus TaxID=96344 RepID=UPI0040349B2F